MQCLRGENSQKKTWCGTGGWAQNAGDDHTAKVLWSDGQNGGRRTETTEAVHAVWRSPRFCAQQPFPGFLSRRLAWTDHVHPQWISWARLSSDPAHSLVVMSPCSVIDGPSSGVNNSVQSSRCRPNQVASFFFSINAILAS
jgi:hypothetical protein